MATYVSSAVPIYGPTSTTTLPHFVAHGSAVSAALDAMGLVKTADTGQIDWATYSAYSAVQHIDRGYEIRRFSDADQATSPIFVKVFYGQGSNSGSAFRLKLQFGTGSDGAGSLTGPVSREHIVGVTGFGWGYTATALGPVQGAGVGGSGVVYYLPNGSDSGLGYFFSIERTPLGAHVWSIDVSTTSWGGTFPTQPNFNMQVLVYNPSHTPVDAARMSLPHVKMFDGSGVSGADVKVVMFADFMPSYVPLRNAIAYYNSDFPLGNIFSVEVAGQLVQYRAMGRQLACQTVTRDTVATNCIMGIAARWE